MPPAAAIAIATIVSAGVSLRAQGQAARGRREALRQQQKAQESAEQVARSEQNRAELESARLNRRKIDPNTLLGRERELSRRGAGATLLSGPRGVAPGQLTLGRSAQLGAGN
jgi:type II secretory pathway pseudopilin PulG